MGNHINVISNETDVAQFALALLAGGKCISYTLLLPLIHFSSLPYGWVKQNFHAMLLQGRKPVDTHTYTHALAYKQATMVWKHWTEDSESTLRARIFACLLCHEHFSPLPDARAVSCKYILKSSECYNNNISSNNKIKNIRNIHRLHSGCL